MKIAYLILAHKSPNLVKKLVERLTCEDCGFFIHIDGKSDIDEFSIIKGENVFYSDQRVKVYWGEYTIVEATLGLMQSALHSDVQYDYLILLSGSDYPLRSNEYIHAFFERNKGTEFISMVEIPNKEAGIPLSRLSTIRFPSTSPIRKFIFRFLARAGLAQRDFQKQLGVREAYGGSMWWALTADACKYILEAVAKNQNLTSYFKITSASDEMFFHTILGNSMFRQRVRRNVMYDDWINVSPHSPHPASITDRHIKVFEASDAVMCNDAFGPGEALFARKFSEDSHELLRKMDAMIELKESK